MRRATLADVDLIKNILLVSFKNDPHVNCLLEPSKNKHKLNILIDYVVDQTFRRGEIYLSDDNNAVALWDFESNEKMSLHYIWRNLAFLIRIGIKLRHKNCEIRSSQFTIIFANIRVIAICI